MKRSRINQVIKDMEALAKENGFHLPPFCSWTPEELEEVEMAFNSIGIWFERRLG